MVQKKTKGEPELGRIPPYPQVELKSLVTREHIFCRHCGLEVDLSKDAIRIRKGSSLKVTHSCGNVFKIIDDGD